jgi:hypothetical protein
MVEDLIDIPRSIRGTPHWNTFEVSLIDDEDTTLEVRANGYYTHDGYDRFVFYLNMPTGRFVVLAINRDLVAAISQVPSKRTLLKDMDTNGNSV